MLYKLGRKERTYNPAVPHMSSLLPMTKLIELPTEIDYADGMPENLGVMLNDTLGDCTCAAYYHALQVWSHHCNPDGLIITEPDYDVLQLYIESCGYDPHDTNTDQGGVEQEVLTYLLNKGAFTGFHGETHHKLQAFVEVDVRNIQDMKRAILQCGVAYIGIQVPTNIFKDDGNVESIWEYKVGATIDGGHAIILTGYDDQGFNLISWGKKYKMTYLFFRIFCQEAYALCDIDWFTATGKTLLGLSIKELEQQMKYLKKEA